MEILDQQVISFFKMLGCLGCLGVWRHSTPRPGFAAFLPLQGRNVCRELGSHFAVCVTSSKNAPSSDARSP